MYTYINIYILFDKWWICRLYIKYYILQYTYEPLSLSCFAILAITFLLCNSCYFSSATCTFSFVPKLPFSFLHQNSWEKWLTKKHKCSQILLVTKHEQMYQVADAMIKEHRFLTDLEHMPRYMNSPMNIF